VLSGGTNPRKKASYHLADKKKKKNCATENHAQIEAIPEDLTRVRKEERTRMPLERGSAERKKEESDSEK